VDYNKLASRLQLSLTAYSATGSLSLSVAAGRLSYSYGLKGPSLAIDTACSSSLVAAHAALSGLRLGHCASAAVGGVNLQLIPDTPATFQKAGRLPFDRLSLRLLTRLLASFARHQQHACFVVLMVLYSLLHTRQLQLSLHSSSLGLMPYSCAFLSVLQACCHWRAGARRWMHLLTAMCGQRQQASSFCSPSTCSSQA
jgi:hypothetical protein